MTIKVLTMDFGKHDFFSLRPILASQFCLDATKYTLHLLRYENHASTSFHTPLDKWRITICLHKQISLHSFRQNREQKTIFHLMLFCIYF